MSVFTRSNRFTNAGEQWKTVDDLYDGIEKMKAGGDTYLPKQKGEETEDYERRLKNAVLFNAYKKTIQSNVGKVFSKEVVMGEDMDPRLAAFESDVDLEGQSLTQFANNLLDRAIQHGITYILVDYPNLTTPATNNATANFRPYFVNIEAPQIIDIRTERVNGAEKLMQVRFIETVSVYDYATFAEQIIEQIREYTYDSETDTVSWRIWRKVAGSSQWTIYEEDVLKGINVIPLVPVYGNRTGAFIGTPVLYDLAIVNIRHYKVNSDYAEQLEFNMGPILVLNNIRGKQLKDGTEQELIISPRTVLQTTSDNGSATYVEHADSAIKGGLRELEHLTMQMNVLGLQMQTPAPGGMTATEKAINASEANSLLKSIALNLQTALETAFVIAGLYMGIENAVLNTKIAINTDFAEDIVSIEDMKVILETMSMGVLTPRDVLVEMKRRNMLNAKFDIDEAVAAIDKAAEDIIVNDTNEETIEETQE